MTIRGRIGMLSVPSVSAGFGIASAEIRRRVEALIDGLARK